MGTTLRYRERGKCIAARYSRIETKSLTRSFSANLDVSPKANCNTEALT